jgi:transcriptional regulator with XRE-family HTH domain/quercetin dioxygenase-like cupin family protein
MPLYTSHLLEYEGLRLGQRVREARRSQGLTLKQLAVRLNTSSARLSEIENERLRLDVQELLAVADALAVPLDALVPPDVSLPYQITRDAELRSRAPRPTLFAGGDGAGEIASPNTYWPLADLFVGRHLEPVLARMAAVAESDVAFCCHHEEEFAFALRGALEFRIKTPDGERRDVLNRGDCIYFRSDLPHAFRALEADGAESVHVFCAPSASSHSGLDGASYRAVAHAGDGSHDVQRQIGEKLRLLREAHGWTVARVARSSGLTERQVLRIERGERSIPLDAMLKLARSFGKPLRELIGFAAARAPYYVVQRASEIPSIPDRQRRTPVERPHAGRSKTCQPLVAAFPARDMYPCFVRLLNVDLETLTLHEHHGQEFIYILEGELELTTYSGERRMREILRAGDSCYIDSTVPHLLRSWTRNPYSETSAEVVDVFWCPLGEAYLFET